MILSPVLTAALAGGRKAAQRCGMRRFFLFMRVSCVAALSAVSCSQSARWLVLEATWYKTRQHRGCVQ